MASLRTIKVYILITYLPNKGKYALTRYLGKVLKMCTNEKRTNELHTNQGLMKAHFYKQHL